MINGRRARLAVLALGAAVLTATALLRGAEYDEQYTLLVTAGTPRPDWPAHALTARDITQVQTGAADPLTIARILRETDVHPPLYFWLAAGWRALGLDSLLALRLFSALTALGSLGMVGLIARRLSLPPVPAMLFTLGCYGFVYTGAIARGFALSQFLVLAGLACGLARFSRPMLQGVAGGVLLGLACLTNYLACFTACAVIAVLVRRPVVAIGMAAGFAVCLPPLAWFFLAQQDSRPGQFPDFAWWPSLARLGRYAVANVFGGMPLYVADDLRPIVSAAVAGLAGLLAGLVVLRWRRLQGATPLLLCAIAPPAGLLTLGLVFQTTPIELRYLSFSTPFVGLLLAGAVGSLGRWARPAGSALFVVQGLALAGLMLRPETMQPARAAAAAAVAAHPELVLVPFGNDGVGVVGGFAREAPPALPVMIVRRDAPGLPTRLTPYRRVAVALLAQDDASRATLAQVLEALQPPPWRAVSQDGRVAVFERSCSAPEPDGAADVLRGVHDREVHPASGDGAGADRRLRPTVGAVAREPADACDLASDGSGVGQALHGDLPGPAGVRLLIETGGQP